jgi:photosystem II stability/assembly factor-like uncharacterized protein
MKHLKRITLLALCAFIFQTSFSQAWELNPLTLSGGGWVTGMVVHPDVPDLMYNRTDVGGANKWNPQKNAWEPITDWIPVDNYPMYGIDAIALDLNDPDLLYLAMGRNGVPGGGRNIYKSTDRGKTFTALNFPHPNNIDGNNHAYDQGRSTGERLQVNPFNSNELIFGTYTGSMGLYQTTDGGQNWNRLDIPGVGDGSEVIMLVHYDQYQENRFYAFVQDVGMFVTTNNGSSFSRLQKASGGDCPAKFVRRIEQGSDGAIYFTNRKSMPFIWKIVDNKAYDVTPSSAVLSEGGGDVWIEDKGMHGIAVDFSDPQHILAAGGLSSGKYHIPVYESKDGGNTWEYLNIDIGYHVPWQVAESVLKVTPSDLVFDQDDPNIVYHQDGSGVCKIVLNETPVTAYEIANGIEETVCFDVKSVAVSGEERVFSGFSDVGGFYHDQGLDQPPSECIHDYWLGGTGRHSVHSYHYCESNPQVIYATGRGNYVDGKDRTKESGYYALFKSTDGGVTWTQFPQLQSSPPYAPWPINAGSIASDINPLEIQVSSQDPDNIVIVGKNPVYSTDGGNNFNSCSDLADIDVGGNFNYCQTLAADPVNGSVFYAYYHNDGTRKGDIYKSTNGGANWNKVYSDLPWAKVYLMGIALKTMPGKEGELWLNLYDEGLWLSEDGGSTWNEIPGFSGGKGTGMARAMDAGVGKDANGAVFVLGQYYGTNGLWVSLDRGSTWENVAPSGIVLANCKVLEASNFEYGKVYCGTTGSGMRYFSNTNNLSVSPTEISTGSAASTNDVNITSNVDWTVTSNQTWATPAPTSGTGNGTVTISIDENTGDFPRNATITFGTTAGDEELVTITQAGTLEYTLTVNSTNGNVLLNPAGGVYPPSTEVTLTAEPFTSYAFDNWTGDLTGSTNPVTITMDGNKTITANYREIQTYNLSVTALNGDVTLTPAGGVYEENTVVTLNATPNSGYEFKDWSGSISGTSNPVDVTMDGDKSITANFVEITDITLQAEDANDLNGTTLGTSLSGYNGTGYITIDKAGDFGYIEWQNVQVPAGTFDVVVRSMDEWGDNAKLTVNGTVYSCDLPGNVTSWTETTVNDVEFQGTGNTIVISDAKQQNIDQIRIPGIVTHNGSIPADKGNITLHPNPVTSDMIYLNQKANVQIIDLMGVVVKSKTNVSSINVGDLSSGVYIANISVNKAVRQIKLIIE